MRHVRVNRAPLLRPEFEDVPLAILTVNFAERMERYCSRLRKCADGCKGKPAAEHRAKGRHDCGAEGCVPHVCRPLAPDRGRNSYDY